MRGLDADEYAALQQAATSSGECDQGIGHRLIARGLLTQPEIVESEPHPVVCLSKLGALAIRCHEAPHATFYPYRGNVVFRWRAGRHDDTTMAW